MLWNIEKILSSILIPAKPVMLIRYKGTPEMSNGIILLIIIKKRNPYIEEMNNTYNKIMTMLTILNIINECPHYLYNRKNVL